MNSIFSKDRVLLDKSNIPTNNRTSLKSKVNKVLTSNTTANTNADKTTTPNTSGPTKRKRKDDSTTASEILQSLILQKKKKRTNNQKEETKSDDKPMQTFQITVPVGAKGKESIEFQLPDGRTVSVEVPAGLKPGDDLRVKVPYPEKHSGIVASPPPENLYRIIADDTKFFFGSETGHLMYPAFDISNNLLGFVLGKAYYGKENYTDLELPAAVDRLKEMLGKTPMGLVYTLGDSRGPSGTPVELIALVASQHCKRQTAKEVTPTKSRKKQDSEALSPITGLKKRPYCPKPVQPSHIATGRWSTDEHALFLKGLAAYGKEWKKVAKIIPTRTIVQVRTHAQKYFQKLEKQKQKALAHQDRWNVMHAQRMHPRRQGPNTLRTSPVPQVPQIPRGCGSSSMLFPDENRSRGMRMMEMMRQERGIECDQRVARLVASMRWPFPSEVRV